MNHSVCFLGPQEVFLGFRARCLVRRLVLAAALPGPGSAPVWPSCRGWLRSADRVPPWRGGRPAPPWSMSDPRGSSAQPVTRPSRPRRYFPCAGDRARGPPRADQPRRGHWPRSSRSCSGGVGRPSRRRRRTHPAPGAAYLSTLRAAGYSWAEIAARLRVTRQAAQQRWGHLQ